jgi:hypothetical protein
MSSPAINTEVLAAMLEYHDNALNAIYAVALLLLVVLVALGVERRERKPNPPKCRTMPVASNWRKKPRRPWRRQKRPTPKKKTKPPAPVHAEYLVPERSQEYQKYSWDPMYTGPLMDEDQKEEVPSPRVPDPGFVPPWETQEYKEDQREQVIREKAWMRIRLAHLIAGGLDDVKCNR